MAIQEVKPQRTRTSRLQNELLKQLVDVVAIKAITTLFPTGDDDRHLGKKFIATEAPHVEDATHYALFLSDALARSYPEYRSEGPKVATFAQLSLAGYAASELYPELREQIEPRRIPHPLRRVLKETVAPYDDAMARRRHLDYTPIDDESRNYRRQVAEGEIVLRGLEFYADLDLSELRENIGEIDTCYDLYIGAKVSYAIT